MEPSRPGPGGGGAPGGTSQWGSGTSALNYLGADTALYEARYTLKHTSQDNPWELLQELTDVLNNTADAELEAELSNYLDIDKTLWFLAHETVFTDDDSYIMKGIQDYYVYYEPETERFVPLEFDGNSALDTRNISWDMFYNEENENFPLMNRLYGIPSLRQRYLAHARYLLDVLLDDSFTDSLLTSYDNLIREAVENDPVNPYSFSEYSSTFDELSSYFSDRKDILQSNAEVDKSGVEIEAVEQFVGTTLYASPSPTELVNIVATIPSSSAVANVYLYYSSYYVGKFTKIEMFDNGTDADITAADGLYTAEIPSFPQGEYVRYYVEVIADDASRTATYSPIGAEHDVYFYRVGMPASVNSSVVINELCASNKSIVADEQGEYDDWIELYNTSAHAISLAGYYLSDDLAELTKWPFPTVSIPAQSYIGIWADNDTEQGVLHANFKLSAGSEELFLITPNGQVADHIRFGEQENDATIGRIENGTGSFVRTDPTYLVSNLIYEEEVSSAIDDASENLLDIQLYPSPVNDYITIETGLDEVVLFTLYNVQGQYVTSEEVYQRATVSVRQFNKGIYIVALQTDDASIVRKIIIE